MSSGDSAESLVNGSAARKMTTSDDFTTGPAQCLTDDQSTRGRGRSDGGGNGRSSDVSKRRDNCWYESGLGKQSKAETKGRGEGKLAS